MTDRITVRLTFLEGQKDPLRELMVDGKKVTDISFSDALDGAVNMTSSLREDWSKLRNAR